MTTFDANNKTHVLALISIVIFCGSTFLIGTTLIIRDGINMEKEQEWYVQNLAYEFSARIDTGFILPQRHGFGKVYGTHSIIEKFDYYKEDSLNNHLSNHARLKFIWKRKSGEINFEVLAGRLASDADCVVVSSSKDKIFFFKDHQKIGDCSISSGLAH